jgi:GNAT superfamily N-acetyltransferase
MLPETARLEDLPPDAQARVRGIYEEAFPARQRDPFEQIVAAARSGDEIALVGLEAGQPVGLAFLSRLDAVGHLFVEYFAVARELRGGGRGGRLWQALREELARCEPGLPIVLEVEDPGEDGIDAGEADQRARRVRFWERAGARLLAVEGYVIPDVGGDGIEPMRLMWVPGDGDGEVPRDERLLALILALYEAGYGLGPEDALVRRAVERWG